MGITDMALLEVMRAQDPKKLKHYVDVARNKMGEEVVRTKGVGRQPKTDQYKRLARKQFEHYRTVLRTPYQPPAPPVVPAPKSAGMWSSQNKRRVKLGTAAALLAAGAYGAYHHYKKKPKERVRESNINADHVKLGLDVMKATGLDQAMAKQMSDGNQRRQAWKYGTRAAAAGLAAPAIGTLGFHAALMAGQIPEARKMGARGIGNTLRKAYELYTNQANPSAEIARQVAQFTFSKPWLGTVGGIGAAGGVYGLMKKAPTPTKISMLTPKKQYKYIRKDNDKYIYPKKVREATSECYARMIRESEVKEVSPELVGRVGRMRHLNAGNAKKSAEFWNTDKAWAKARAADSKYTDHLKTVSKRVKRHGPDWHARAKKSMETPTFGEKGGRLLKGAAIAGGVGAAAYGAHRLRKWWKSKPAKAEKPKVPDKVATKLKQDPTQPESYPFKDSEIRHGNLMEREYLRGGKADGMSASRFPQRQLRMGRKVEKEHTNNPRIAEEIAKDHLAEYKDYYTRLAQMEKKAKKTRSHV